MSHYVFVLGRNPSLSLAELDSILSITVPGFTIEHLTEEVCVISTPALLDPVRLMKQLGGTVKIGRVIESVALDADRSALLEVLSAHRLRHDFLPQRSSKMHIGVSLYDAGTDQKLLAKWKQILDMINILVKETLQEEHIRSGFVQIKERTLSSVSVKKNELLTKGAEILLVATGNSLLIGKTEAVQEFEAFSLRDYYRPAKDMRSGILPPKVARIMVNIARKQPHHAILLDPFCGSGTVLQEAIMLEYSTIIGTDISEKAIADTRKNLQWLQKYVIDSRKRSVDAKIFVQDVRQLAARIPHSSVDIIVTEPYLGPPLYRRPNPGMVRSILSEVQKLLGEAFVQFSKILKPDGTIVIIFPAFFLGNTLHRLSIDPIVTKQGFHRLAVFSEPLRSHPFLKNTPKDFLLYGGKDQSVHREISMWKKR